MPTYEHKQILSDIARLDAIPSGDEEFERWMRAGAHLEFVAQNGKSDEIVVYASGEFSFVHAVVVSDERLAELGEDDLTCWGSSPYTSIASYVSGGGRDDVWLERAIDARRSSPWENATQLIFGRTFEGWEAEDRTYFEVNQEYSHVAGIHWRPEHRAYCRFDQNGDLQQAVSITAAKDHQDVRCVSFAWQPLEEYLVATKSSLAQRFDFTLLRRANFAGWPSSPDSLVRQGKSILYRQKVLPNVGAYTTGVQLIGPRTSKTSVYDRIVGRHEDREYVEFLAQDWRNKRIARISTDPAATANYFNAGQNSLPFELSPAFFKPDVILKYKTDSEKYTLNGRSISCRCAWHLKEYDVNEAGQIFAYICDLLNLPYAEQQHWKAHNEPPKVGISERAFKNDFLGQWASCPDPLRDVLSVLSSWKEQGVSWWTLRGEKLLGQVTMPLTASRDEWSEAFMALAKLVVEGFELPEIRARLKAKGIPCATEERSIALLERLISGSDNGEGKISLEALRTIQQIRTKVKGHASGSEVEALVREVISQYETFTHHFQSVCHMCALELQAIARAFT